MDTDPKHLNALIQAYLDERITDGEFEELQLILAADGVARRMFVEASQLDSALCDLGSEEPHEIVPFPKRKSLAVSFAAVAALIALLLLPILFIFRPDEKSLANLSPTRGVAVVAAESGAVWAQKNISDSPLEPGRLILKKGLAQIDFFGGASVSLSGPADLELVDRDTAILHRGTLRAEVPPAARGFEIHTKEVRLEDLGTSFGVSVSENNDAELIVFDGEVRSISKSGETTLHSGGDAARWQNGEANSEAKLNDVSFPGIADVIAGSGNRQENRYSAWKENSIDRQRDARLIAYYDFENLSAATRRLRNRAVHGQGSEFDGGIVGARVAEGRWPGKTALDFRAPGDRVRFDIPGEYKEITLFAWVRIDALDRNLNSLFLTDYFDEYEIHWQLSKLGALHFATSPEGVRDIPKNNRRYYSDRFWDPTKSGQWYLLVTTAKAGSGQVTHYINGKVVGFSGGTNRKKPITVMRIGEADLGNWSEPIWPEASIRTLNGRIDEFGIYQTALSADEIAAIYEVGKP